MWTIFDAVALINRGAACKRYGMGDAGSSATVVDRHVLLW